jgi:5-formyltetrahydrofolate cyclo-ligase
MTKKELRKIYKDKRMELSATERLKMDDLILIQLQRLSIDPQVQTIMSYWQLEKYAEPNTHLYTYYFEHAIPQVQLCYPVMNNETLEMKAILIHEDTDFEENAHGIPEPEGDEVVPPQRIDFVMVPLLAFDKQGYRVGYGKGYYDRFLQQCRPDVLTIGFSYFEAVDKIDDTNQFDVPLNYCITPQHLYEF